MPNQTKHYHLGCGERLQAKYPMFSRQTNRQMVDAFKLSEQERKQRVKQGS